MEDNYLNDRLRNSMDTPRDIPFDDNEWDKVAARLDAAQPIPKPFVWHWLAFAALIPLLAWNVWLQSKLNDKPQNVVNHKSVVVFDTLATKHTTMVFDTVYTIINKTIYKKNIVQSIDNQYVGNSKKEKKSLLVLSPGLADDAESKRSLFKETVKNDTKKATKAIVIEAVNKNINTGNTEEASILTKTNSSTNVTAVLNNNATENVKQAIEVPKTQDVITENKVQAKPVVQESLEVSAPLRGVDIPVDSVNITDNIADNSAAIVNTIAQEASINDAFDARTPIKVTPAKERLHIGLQSLSLEGGNNLSYRFEENFGGIGVQFKLSPQWSVLTGLQVGGGSSDNFRDSFPHNFMRPKPTNPKDKYRDADIEYYSFNVPIMVRWKPSYFDKYRIMPYVSMGSIINFGGETQVGYRFEDQNGEPYQKPKEQSKNEGNFFVVANIGAEAKIYRKFAVFTQLQYRVPVGNSRKIENQYQNLMIQSGVKYNF